MVGPTVCRCGASLPSPDLVGLATCPSCGRVTRVADPAELAADPQPTTDEGDREGAGWPTPPVAAPVPTGTGWAAPPPIPGAPTPPPPASSSASPPSNVGRTAGKVGCALVPLIIGVVVVAVIVSAVRSCDVSTPGDVFGIDGIDTLITLSGTATVLDAGPEGIDLVATTQTSDTGGVDRRLSRVRFGPDGPTEVWRSQELSDSVSDVEVAQVGDVLFAAYGDRLLALDEATGETRWATTLRDQVTVNCDDCFAAVGDHLVVRTTDAYVTAYGTASAEPRWSNRLRSPSGSIATPGPHLLVVDDPEDPSATTPVVTLDPATGKRIAALAPTCTRGEDGSWDVELSPGDPVHAVPGSDDVVAVFGFGDSCVVRWNPADGAVRWTSRLNGASTIDDDSVVVGPKDIAMGVGTALVTVDLATGAAKLLEVPADTQAVPDRIVGRTLVADTTSTRGTPRGGLAAWDLRTGERRWANRDLGTATAASRNGFSDALFDGSPRFVVVPEGADGLAVVVFDGTQGTFTSRTVDLATGDLGAPVKRAYLREYEGIASLDVEAITDDQLVVSIDNLLQVLPSSGQGPVWSYPPQ